MFHFDTKTTVLRLLDGTVFLLYRWTQRIEKLSFLRVHTILKNNVMKKSLFVGILTYVVWKRDMRETCQTYVCQFGGNRHICYSCDEFIALEHRSFTNVFTYVDRVSNAASENYFTLY